MSQTNFFQKQEGVVLYITIIVLSVLTGAVLALSNIINTQIKVVLTAGDSTKAFFAADAGIERALKDRSNPLPAYSGFLDLNNNGLSDVNQDAFWEVVVSDSGGSCAGANYCVRSQGRFRNIYRAIAATY